MKTGPKPLSGEDALIKLLQEAVPEGDCLLIKGRRSVGIGYKRIRANHHDYYVHRLAYEQYHRCLLLTDEVVRHSCDRPNCIARAHLIVGSHGDNVADKIAKQRHCFGEGHYKAAFTDDDIRYIRNSTKFHHVLADEFGVSRPTITQIKLGKTWKHIR